MNIKKTIAISLSLFLLCTSVISCGQNAGNDTPTTSTTAASTVGGTMAARPSAPVDHASEFEAAFALAAEAREGDLQYTVGTDGITITKYTGSGESVKIPGTLNGTPIIAIADGAFADQAALKILVLPDSLGRLGKGMLTGCSSLAVLHVPFLGETPTSTQYLGYFFGSETHLDHARDVVASLKLLSVGSGLSAIPDFALFDCNELLSVRLDASIRSLGVYSLYRCKSLQSINTEHLQAVAEHALDNCTSLTHLRFGASLVSMGLGALEGCASLQSLTLPFVGGSATEHTYLAYLFGAAAPDFAKGYYPNKLVEINLLSTCTSLGNYAFYEFPYLTYLRLEEGITSIGVRAFYGCTSLHELSLPNSLKSIGDNAFFGCSRLERITFGTQADSLLERIGINAFYNCISLVEVTLPNALHVLPASCFASCTSLQRVDLGGVTTVQKNAFYSCPKLQTVTEHGSVTYEE